MAAPSYLGLRLHGDIVGPLPPADRPTERSLALPPRDRHPPALYLGRDGVWRCGGCHEDPAECACP